MLSLLFAGTKRERKKRRGKERGNLYQILNPKGRKQKNSRFLQKSTRFKFVAIERQSFGATPQATFLYDCYWDNIL